MNWFAFSRAAAESLHTGSFWLALLGSVYIGAGAAVGLHLLRRSQARSKYSPWGIGLTTAANAWLGGYLVAWLLPLDPGLYAWPLIIALICFAVNWLIALLCTRRAYDCSWREAGEGLYGYYAGALAGLILAGISTPN